MRSLCRATVASSLAAIKYRTTLAMGLAIGVLSAPASAAASGTSTTSGTSFDYTATAPPDTGKVDTVLGYCAWGVLLLCVLGVFGAIAKMVSAHHTGRSAAEYVPALFVCGAGAILSGAAGSLITGLV